MIPNKHNGTQTSIFPSGKMLERIVFNYTSELFEEKKYRC